MLLKILSSLRINIQQLYGAMLHEWRLFIKFLRTRQLLLWAVLLVVVISYSVKIFNYDYSIDTGRALYDYNGILMSWEGIHRYSLVFLKEVLFPLGLNIYLANILTMLTLVLVTVTILYMCARITNRLVLKRENIWLEIAFAAIFITSPIVLEQLNFTLQNFEVALGTLFATLAPAFVWFGYVRKNLLSIIVGSLLYAFCIAIYQSFAPYIMMISVFFVFMVLLGYGVGRPYRLLSVLVLSFILSFIIYVSASYVLYSAGITEASVFSEATGGGDSYLRRQIVWSDSVYDALINIKDYIWNISTGVGIFYTSLPLICVVIILYKLLTRNERKSIILQQVLLLGALCLTAVVLAIVLGQGEEIRARYPVQPVLAALLLYIAYTLVVSRRANIAPLRLAY